MRKIVSGLFITLDGVTEEPSNWQETFDEDMGERLGATLPEIDTILLGRVTYQYWAGYWPNPSLVPDQNDFFARFINHTPKYVVSSTLDRVEWGEYGNVTLIRDNVAEELEKLKQQPGKTIAVQGSPTLVNWLLQHDLLDELQLYVHNVVTYQGERLFKAGALKRLNLVDSKISRSGVAMLTYQPRKA